MEDADIRCLEIEQDYSNITKILARFVQNNVATFTFENLNKNGNRQKLSNIVFKLLDNPDAQQCHKECLETFRILSRDRKGLNEMIDDSKILTLLKAACLFKAEEAIDKTDELNKVEIILEALKALCNLVYNSSVAANYVSHLHASEGIVTRMKLYREMKIPVNIRFFDMKLLFLITALSSEARHKLRHELHALVYLTEILDLILKESPPKSKDSHYVKLTDIDCDICCEILKIIFNIIAKPGGIGNVPLVNEDLDESVCLRLTCIIHDLLLTETSPHKQDELINHSINLLTSVPKSCYSEIMTTASRSTPKELELEGKNMEAFEVMLQFLDRKLEETQDTRTMQEILSPVLTVLLQLSRNERLARKYLRQRILPPLKDVMTRPEVGDTLRAKICRLLTSPSSTIKNICSDLVFILCKENVARVIKYAGYGNAAGLFADRGLLFTGEGIETSTAICYSSDSDSDTEEYSKYADLINPVIGCYEAPRRNPMEEMTEEQKEFEAVKLANMLDKLSREGIIQPCQVGEDGRPQPVEHILKLLESLPSQQVKPAKQ